MLNSTVHQTGFSLNDPPRTRAIANRASPPKTLRRAENKKGLQSRTPTFMTTQLYPQRSAKKLSATMGR